MAEKSILEQFDEIAQEHKSVAVLATTADINSVLHAEIRMFMYDEEEKGYVPSNVNFNEFIAADKNPSETDLKKMNVSLEDYRKSAIDRKEFSNKLQEFVIGDLSDTTLITVSKAEYTKSQFEKVDEECAILIADKEEKGELMDGNAMLSEYLLNTAKDTASLSYRSLCKELHGGSFNSITDNNDTTKISTFLEMLNRQCENNPELQKQEQELQQDIPEEIVSDIPDMQYTDDTFRLETETENVIENNGEELDFLAEKFSGAEIAEQSVSEPAPAIPEKVEKNAKFFQQNDENIRSENSRKGKERYASADIDGKTEILTQMGKISPEKVMNPESDCDIRKLQHLISGEDGNRGFTVMQVGTTGFRTGGFSKGSPTQISVQHFSISKDDSGEVSLRRDAGADFLVKADEKALEEAILNADNGGYDVFAKGGIDRQEYTALCEKGESNPDKKFFTVEQAEKRLQHFFANYASPENNPVVALGGQFPLQALKDWDIFEKDAKGKVQVIDMTKAIMEYSYLVMNDSDYQQKNVLFPNGEVPEHLPDFKAETIAEMNGMDIAGSAKKTDFIINCIQKMEEQLYEMKMPEMEIEQKPEQKIAEPQAEQKSPSNTEKLNQSILSFQENIERFTSGLSEDIKASKNQTEKAETPREELIGQRDIVSALHEQKESTDKLIAALSEQNENTSHTNFNTEKLISSMSTMINFLGQQIDMMKESLHAQKEENRILLETIKENNEQHNQQVNNILFTMNRFLSAQNEVIIVQEETTKALAEEVQQTKEALAIVGQMQTEQSDILEVQNSFSKGQNALIGEVAAGKQETAEIKETLNKHSEKLDEHEKKIETVKNNISTLGTKLQAIVKNSKDTAKAIMTMNEKLNKQNETLKEEGEMVKTALDNIVVLAEVVDEIQQDRQERDFDERKSGFGLG